MAERDGKMKTVKFEANGVLYMLSEKKEYGRNTYNLSSQGGSSLNLLIRKEIVKTPDGKEEIYFGYNPQSIGVSTDMAVAEAAIDYLKKHEK